MTKSDRDIVISIVTRAFEENPRAQAMMKQGNPTRSVRHMTEYAYKLVDKFDGIYLSEDKTKSCLMDSMDIISIKLSCMVRANFLRCAKSASVAAPCQLARL